MTIWVATPSSAQNALSELQEFNSRFVAIKVPASEVVKGAILQVATGYWVNELPFKEHVILTQPLTSTKTMVELPRFGIPYTWRVVQPNKKPTPVSFRFFRVGSAPYVDPSNLTMVVTQQALKFKESYVCSDLGKAIYDMKGEPIWYLPAIPGKVGPDAAIRDLKITPQNTITFILNESIFEVSWEGKILWEGPDRGEISEQGNEGYHHEFTRLSNGHYMTLGNEFVCLRKEGNRKPKATRSAPGEPPQAKLYPDSACYPFTTIIEYDAAGTVVWSWKSYPFFEATVLDRFKDTQPKLVTHCNSFFFSEKENLIYVSFKNTSQILKVSYPSGRVLAAYGKGFQSGENDTVDALFCDQHAIRRSPSGELYMFNNNLCHMDREPTVLVCKEKVGDAQNLQPVWQFTCPMDWSRETEHKRTGSSGGCVYELKDKSYFVNICSPQAGMFIVDRNKKILWSAYINFKTSDGLFHPSGQYRCSMIPDKQTIKKMVLR